MGQCPSSRRKAAPNPIPWERPPWAQPAQRGDSLRLRSQSKPSGHHMLPCVDVPTVVGRHAPQSGRASGFHVWRRCAGAVQESDSFTSQPDDLDQQEAPDQQGRESDKNDSPHSESITTEVGTRSRLSGGTSVSPPNTIDCPSPGLGEVSVSGGSKPPSLSIFRRSGPFCPPRSGAALRSSASPERHLLPPSLRGTNGRQIAIW
jgi:hypothetical protein